MFQVCLSYLIVGPPTEKASEFIDFHLKSVMQRSWFYIKDSGDFIKKNKRISIIPDDAILGTADVVGLYPNISHGLKTLQEALQKRQEKYFIRSYQNG